MAWTVRSDELTACELFNAGAEAFRVGDIVQAVTHLRGGFFENLYVSPLLLGEEFYAQKIWYPSGEAEPPAAREYVKRYGRFWKDDPRALEFLGEVWNDPLVRAELKTYLNLSRNLLAVGSETDFNELLRERDLFLNPERIRRTQTEIIARLQAGDLRVPLPRPRLALTLLASKDPAATVEFYRQLLEIDPKVTSQSSGGYAEFDLDGVHLVIHGEDGTAPGDPYRLGPPPASFGWGALFVFRVAHLDYYHENAKRAGFEIVDQDLGTEDSRSRRRRFFVVKDPSGYLVELTEEDPKGDRLT